MDFWQLLQRGLFLQPGMDLRWLFLGYFLVIAVSYLLGSVNTAVLVSKLVYGDDVRKHGSGNGGMTNMFRVFGKKAGLLTLAGDLLKTFLSVGFAYIFLGSNLGGPYLAGFFCVFGHVFPIYYRFKGGKGVLAAAMTLLMVDPVTFGVAALIFALMFFTTKIVSLSSITAAVMFPLVSYAFHPQQFIVSVVFSLGLSLFVVVMHKDNIRRLLNREEKPITLGKKKPKKEEEPKEEPKRSLLEEDEDETN